MDSNVNCLIGEHEFVLSTLTPEQSQESRELLETPLMNGTVYNSFGAYKPMRWNATCSLACPDNDLCYYDSVFKEIEASPQEISCPALGDIFTAWVTVKKTPDQYDYWINLELTITECNKDTDYRIDNNLFFTGERTTVFGFRAVTEEEETDTSGGV